MGKVPFAHFFANKSNIRTVKHNGFLASADGWLVGISSTKGFMWVRYRGRDFCVVGRDGVAKETNAETRAFSRGDICSGIGHGLKARLLHAPLDILQTAVTAPLGAAIHGTATVGCLAAAVVTIPLALCSCTRAVPVFCGAMAAANGVSTVANVVGAAVAPLEVVTPEINTKLLKTHHWGGKVEGVD